MLKNLFRPRPQNRQAEALYALAVEQARAPAFYTRLGVADRIDARFELYTLHVLLLFLRLKDEGEPGAEVAQRLFDTYVSSLDNVLRELGVGDVSVGKKMRKLGEALYGRMSVYEKAIRDGDRTALSSSLARNILDSEETERGAALADYALASREALAAQSLLSPAARPVWAEISR